MMCFLYAGLAEASQAFVRKTETVRVVDRLAPQKPGLLIEDSSVCNVSTIDASCLQHVINLIDDLNLDASIAQVTASVKCI